MNPTRRPRADARRNYERLLAEADSVFHEHGTDASLERVARQAGVAIGTLYGHFPNRRALVAALLRERHETLFDLGARLTAGVPPADALDVWVRAVVVHTAAYRGLAALLADGLGDEASELHAACRRMTSISESLIAGARAAGAIRPDVAGEDVFALMNAAAWVHVEISPAQSDRLVTFTLDGLAAHASPASG
ncbi:TetR/AcrR family transcriptional regulator [Spirillospora sp. CA-294931]|uniref:TetR/AcrR family transcriptional regulator n=1 Tax=Spirillospora sp. CA-294931 TaxID=3240042 RepID=UPI003D8C44CB